MKKLLNKIIDAFGVSSQEKEVREIIKEELKDVNCEMREDKLGNLIVKMGQGSEKVMICAHMDAAGFITTFVEEDGALRVASVGDIDYKNSIGRMVKFQSGAKGRLCASKENPEERDIYIDTFTNNKEETLKFIKEGDLGCLEAHVEEINGKIIGTNLHRTGCYVLLEAIKSAKNLSKEYYFVFSTQKELEARGARAAAYDIKPDYCIVLDCMKSNDVKGGEGRIKLSHGPVISIIDSSLIIDAKVKTLLDESAEKASVKVQYGINREEYTDGWRIHKEVGGIRTGALSIPLRYKYSASEVMDIKDVEDTIKIISGILN